MQTTTLKLAVALAILAVTLLAASAAIAEETATENVRPNGQNEPAGQTAQDAATEQATPESKQANPDEKDSDEKNASDNTPADPFPSLIRMVGSMVVVLGLMMAAAYGAKRFLNNARFGNRQPRLVRVRQTINLGSRRQLFLLEADDRLLLVGATSENIRLISKLPRPAEDATGDTDAEMADAAPFADVLDHADRSAYAQEDAR